MSPPPASVPPSAHWTPPRAVVFDLDGLMFNTEELHFDVGTLLLSRRGRTYDEQLRSQMMGRPGRVSLQLMIDYHQLSDTVAQLAQETEDIFADILESRLQTTHGLPQLLDRLEAAGIPKAIGTSSGRKYVAQVLGQFGYAPRFAFVLTAEDVVQGKPEPEIYLSASARFGLPPADVLVLEDSHNGCRAAVRAGTRAVAVPGPHSRHHDFTGAHLVIDHLADPRLYAALGLD